MIILILILTFILRLINLNQSLWLDEAVQAITAQNCLSYIFQEITGDFHPPLYYFLMHFWVRNFGSSEVALRMPSVLFGVGTVYFVYRISNLSHLRNLSYLGALFLATAPFHIYYSQEARMYSMVTFFASLSMYFFVKINKLTRLRINGLFILYFASTVLMIYSDYYGFLVLLAQGIYLLVRRKYKYLILNTCFLILCYLPWISMFVTQIKTGMLATQALPDWGKLVNVSFVKAVPLTLIKFTIGRITIFDKRIYSLVILGILGMLGVLGYKIYNYYKNYKEKNHFLEIVLLWFFVPMVVSWLVSLFVPNFQPFRLLLILPAFYLLLSTGIENFNVDFNLYRFRITCPLRVAKQGGWESGMTRKMLIGLILTINIVSLGTYYFNPYFHREDWKGLVKYLQQQEDSVVILPSSASSWPIKYYDPEGKIKMIMGISGIGEIVPAFVPFSGTSAGKEVGVVGGEEESKIFFINYLTDLFDPNGLIEKKLVSEGYNKVNEISFNQIPLWEFARAKAR